MVRLSTATLGTQRLHKSERPRKAKILLAHPDVPLSPVYGAPHFLGLFVRAGAMLAYTSFDEKSLALLLGYLHDFLKHLAKNSAPLLTASNYKVASAATGHSPLRLVSVKHFSFLNPFLA